MRQTLVVATVGLIALIAIGCGSSSESSQSTSTSGEGGNADRADARACLEKHGVDVPERPDGDQTGTQPPGGEAGPPGGGVLNFGGAPRGDDEKARDAFEKCGLDTPQRRMKPASNARFRQSIKKYVSCVREHGFDLPDPNLSGNGPVFDSDEVDQEDPAFVKASRQCQSVLGQGAPAPPADQGQEQG